MSVTDLERAAFDARGFFVRRGVFTQDEIAVVRAALERLYAEAQGLTATGLHRGSFFVVGPSPSRPDAADAPQVVHRVVWAGGMEPALLRLSEDARLIEPALALLGSRRCEQLLCQAHFKMPNDGVAFDWHQDIQHRDKGGGTWTDVNGRGSFVQTILLVDAMTSAAGPLEFVPAEAATLDERGRLVRDAGEAAVDRARATPVTGEPGDVLFFGPYAVHGSTPNRSTAPRRVLINGYAAPGANARVYPGDGACRTLPAAARQE